MPSPSCSSRPRPFAIPSWLPVFALALGCGSDANDGGDPSAGGTGAAGGDGGSGASGPDDAPAAEPFDPAGCASPSAAPGDNPTLQIEHEGMMREYILFVPPDIDPSKPTPVVLNWHGLTSAAIQQQAYAGNGIATERRHIVAYPNGLGDAGGQSFNGGVCCSLLGTPPHEADDVGFGKAIVADIATRLCVDRRRIYSTGMSNGGYMSEFNACEAADFYAAVAPVSAIGIPRTECSPSRPIPLIAFNGTEDGLVSYEISQESVARWVTDNSCTGQPVRTDHGGSYCDRWAECAGGVEVIACTVTGMEHCWPGNPLALPGFCEGGGLTDIDANQQMYDFFERFALPAQ
jgi:polyhydroxybutyrate depolymerase